MHNGIIIIVLLGDININLLGSSAGRATQFYNLLAMFSLSQIVSVPTRVTLGTESLIDILCVSNSVQYENVVTFDMHCISNHVLLSCELYIEKEPNPVNTITIRNYNQIDLNSFALYATYNVQWKEILYVSDIHQEVDILQKLVLDLFDRHAPMHTITKTKKKNKP